VQIEHDMKKAIFKEIIEYMYDDETPYVDIIAVANQGGDFSSHGESKYLGSTADGILRNAKANILFVA
jgi:hypothetical protein